MFDRKVVIAEILKYKFLIIAFLVILISAFFFVNLHITFISDLNLANDTTIYAGLGEPCESFYTKVQCEPSLECVLISSTGNRNGVCMKKGTVLPEDSILRNNIIKADDSNVTENYSNSTLNFNNS